VPTAFRLVFLSIFAVMACTAPARADAQSDLCFNEDPDISIAGCTALIKSGHEPLLSKIGARPTAFFRTRLIVGPCCPGIESIH
jgi:hypothetical protein